MANRFLNFLRSKIKEPDNSTAAQVESVERRAGDRWEALGQVGLAWVDEAGESHSAGAAMIERSAHGLRIVSPVELAVGDEIFVTLPQDEQVKAAVRHLAESQGSWHLGLRLVRRDRRRFQRFPSNGKAVMHWFGANQGTHEATVEVRNIAEDGMQIKSPEQIPSGTTVKLTGQSMECFGVTWYCRPDEEGFMVGVQMTRDPYHRDALDFEE